MFYFISNIFPITHQQFSFLFVCAYSMSYSFSFYFLFFFLDWLSISIYLFTYLLIYLMSMLTLFLLPFYSIYLFTYLPNANVPFARFYLSFSFSRISNSLTLLTFVLNSNLWSNLFPDPNSDPNSILTFFPALALYFFSDPNTNQTLTKHQPKYRPEY